SLYTGYLLITFLSLAAAMGYASSSLKAFHLREVESDLKDRARLVENRILSALDPLDGRRVDALCKEIGRASSMRVTVILPSGRVVGDSEEDPSSLDNHLDRPEVRGALTGEIGSSSRYSLSLDRRMMYVAVSAKKDGRVLALVRTSVGLQGVYSELRTLQLRIAIGGLVVAVLAALISYVVSRSITRPLREIRKGAERFARGDFQSRLPVADLEEFGALSETMNQMAQELQERVAALTRQREEYEAVLSSMVEGVLGVDTGERILGMNEAAARIFGCGPRKAQGRSIQEVVRNADLQRFVRSALSSEGPLEKDIPHYADGERILNAHGSVLRDAAGLRMGALIVLHDITRLRRLENINREFVANASHEIKTPITAIKGFVETLREGAMDDPENARHFLEIIDRHVRRLETLTEDLLSLSRIEDEVEKGRIDLEEGRLAEVLKNAVQSREALASGRGIGVEVSCDEDLRARFDRPLLEQALVNLLDNAVKYSEEGGAVRLAASEEKGEILISVTDQGCGIEKEHLDRLFERFYRVDDARSRKMGGTGLGLAIIKHIAQAHGGRVTVKSVPGMGSTFTLHLPKPVSQDAPLPE
ncbi:MAG: HAMP domain-containing protein, partial [Deltaproteobacteria bacterium]|nr:HAMP domain-containing protein [Deltaproteobacteria bacterium]